MTARDDAALAFLQTRRSWPPRMLTEPGPDDAALEELAKKHGVTPTGIATAWITRHPADIQVVLGSTKAQRVLEVAAGSDVRLSRPEWYRLFTAAGYLVP